MRYLIVAIVMLNIVLPVYAQTGEDDPEPGDCGNGLPCGPIPWQLPYFPPLISPTPISDNVDPNPFTPPTETPTPTITFTPSSTPTPSATNTAFFDQSVLNDNVATISALIDATEEILINAEGTEIVSGDAMELASNASTYFSYLKGFSLSNTLGIFAPFVVLLLFYLNISFFLAILKFTLPMIAIVVGVVRKIINVILNFT